jgi:gluconate 2-dehydrogenase alpha chain
MRTLKPVDVVIAGGGWTGLLMAKEITTRTSLSVVVLERGPGRKMMEYAAGMDELDYNVRYRMMQNIAEETVTHRHSSGDTAVPVRQYGSFNPGTGVGGAGEHWSGLAYRYHPNQFRLATHLREKHGARLPENIAIQDWGVSYDELEPYYWRAEQMMGVGGKAGNLRGARVEGGNIFEGPRGDEYPNPPHPNTDFTARVRRAALDLGYHPYPIPAATLSRNYRNPDGVERSGCAYCGYCMRYGCMIGAKAQPSNTLMPVLAKEKSFTLRTGCRARRVMHRDGKAMGISYIDEAGQETVQPANVVVLSSWTLNNVRLLFLSGIGDRYDPATGKGSLGKNLTHQVCEGRELFFDTAMNTFMGAGGLGTAIGDFEEEDKLDAGVFRGGGLRGASSGAGPIASFGRLPEEAEANVAPNWGSAWKKAAIECYDKAASLMFEGEHFSYRQNFMDLDPVYKDNFGDPLLRLTLDWTDHERRQAAMATRIQDGLIRVLGAKRGGELRGVGKHYSVVYYQSSHVQGGAMMAAAPEAGVINPFMQHWGVPNLFVLGGSAFPQNGSGNPTLTLLALTYRAADAFVERYIKRPGLLV